jgi:hypothetical protein
MSLVKTVVASSIENNLLTISVVGFEPLVIDPTKLTPELQLAAMLHGLKQKLSDAAALPRNTDTGASATTQDKYDAIYEIHSRLVSGGEWNKVKAGTGTGMSGASQLARAMVELTGKTRTEIDAFLATKSIAEKNALKADERVAVVIARQNAKPSTIDTSSMLDELLPVIEAKPKTTRKPKTNSDEV